MNNASKAHSDSVCVRQLISRDLGAKTLRALTKRGIKVIGVTTIPGQGELAWANGIRGYQVSDNGTGRILSHLDLLSLAG